MGLSCITWALGKWRERQSKAKLSELGRSFRWRMNLGKGRALSLAGLSIALVSQLWWTLSASWGTVIARNRSFYHVLDCRDVNAHVLRLCFVENGCGVCVEWPVVVFPALHWQPWRSSIFSALCWALLSLSLSIQIAIGGLLLLFFFPNIIPIIIFVSILEYFLIFFMLWPK